MEINSNKEIEQKIYSLLSQYKDENFLSNQMSLLHDIGIDGIDAERIMKQYFDYFKIESSEFRFELYFGRESASIFHFIKERLENLFSDRNKMKRLTIQMMIDSAIRGKWMDSE